MSNKIKRIFKRILPQKNFQRFYLGLYYIGLWGMNYGNGYNTESSGEIHVLKHIKQVLTKKRSKLILFDVGANSGDYSLLLNKIFNKSEVYAFEPLDYMCDIIQEKLASVDSHHIKLHQTAMGDALGELPIFTNKNESSSSSLVQFRGQSNEYESKVVQIDTIDNFITSNKIKEIDLLKIDVEGYELKVLQGASKSILDKKIQFIQFEFGGTMIDSKTFFKEIFELLSPNFKIYRVLKSSLYHIKEYHPHLEIFHYSNFLAVRK